MKFATAYLMVCSIWGAICAIVLEPVLHDSPLLGVAATGLLALAGSLSFLFSMVGDRS